MSNRILHILDAVVVNDFVLKLEFDDGTVKSVDVKPLLTGPVFQPLHDPRFFAKVSIDPISQTVVWPNGADFAPEALYELRSIESVA
jgi:hypothetical protein